MSGPARRLAIPPVLALLLAGLAPPTPAQPDAGEAMAFVAEVEGNWELFLWRADGVRRLTHTPVDERSPRFSRDGGRIAYATSDGALWIAALEDGTASRLPLPEGRYNHPAWTPDDTGIIYAAYTFSDHREDADLWRYTFADDRARPLVMQPGVQDHPVYSVPDERLVYLSSAALTLSGSGFQVVQQLWSVSLLDGRFRQLLPSSFQDTEPAVSPDGRWIAFSSDRGGAVDLWLMDSGGDRLRRLTATPHAETLPVFSPDGRRLAYISTQPGHGEARVMDLKSGQETVLTPFADQAVPIRDLDWR